MTTSLFPLAETAVQSLKAAGLTVATAESCTGGLVAAALTAVPGASSVIRYGWITYCNEAKERQLGVPLGLIEQFSAVSEAVVAAMAMGAMRQAGADIAVAISGNAGPTAGEGEPPVGTVCLAICRRGSARATHTETIFRPDMSRNELRLFATKRALSLIIGAS